MTTRPSPCPRVVSGFAGDLVVTRQHTLISAVVRVGVREPRGGAPDPGEGRTGKLVLWNVWSPLSPRDKDWSGRRIAGWWETSEKGAGVSRARRSVSKAPPWSNCVHHHSSWLWSLRGSESERLRDTFTGASWKDGPGTLNARPRGLSLFQGQLRAVNSSLGKD